jgi:putative ABC transport system permease protein
MPSRVVGVEGHARSDGRFDEALSNVVTPGYFDVMGIRVQAGQDFAPLNDRDAAPQAIVNDEFVRRFVPGGEPIGRWLEARGRRFIIAGVVSTSLYNAFGEPPAPMIYFSYRDMPQPRGEIHMRARGPVPASLAPEVRRVMREVDGELPVFNVRSMADHVETNLIFRRIPARMFAVLGPVLLALAAIGIYAVVAYAVAVRRTEIAVRIALGATPPQVARQFTREHMRVIGIGGLLGWAAALLAVSGTMGMARADPIVFAGVPVVLLGVALVACALPAWRAARASSSVQLSTFLA